MAKTSETVFLRPVLDKVDATRTKSVDESLSEVDKQFIWLLQSGDLAEIRNFLVDAKVNPDCCNYRGHRALDIAIINRDIDLVTFLLDNLSVTVTHFYCALLRAVFENEIDILDILLNRAEEDSKLYASLNGLMNGGPECFKCVPDVVATNLTPTMAAATLGNVEITKMLLERGYIIPKPHSLKCSCPECCSKRFQTGETLTESIRRITAYRALASPTYLIFTSEDPILQAFEMSQEMKELATELPEHQKEYLELSTQCSTFAAAILNQCRNTEEVQTVLVQKKGFNDPRPHKFSRLHLAVQFEQKEFVTHACCQQVLRTMWVETVGTWYGWPFRWRALYVIKHALLTPIVSLGFIFLPRAEIIAPLKVPLNRFIYCATTYLFFLALLLVTLLNDRRYAVNSPVTWTEIAVGCFVIGHSWDIVTNLISVGVSNYFRSFWSVFDLLMFSLFLVTEILWFSVYTYSMFSGYDKRSSNRMCWNWYHPILIGEGIYATASVMAFSRLVLWFQVNSKLGPLGTSMRYMLINVFQFFVMFFILTLAFSVGINSIYKNYKDSERVQDGEVIKQPTEFLTLKATFKYLFWALFGMGDPDYAQIVVGNSSTIINGIYYPGRTYEHVFTEGIGYTLWGFYHMVTVVLLLNMLIAMMTESYQRVQKNADMEWKYACSTLWLSVFDNHSIVPPPFNLIPSMHKITVLSGWISASFRGNFNHIPGKVSCSPKRCCYWEKEVDYSERTAEYEKLMRQLIRRYLHCKSVQSKSQVFYEATEEFREQLKKEIFQDLRISDRYRNRRYTRKAPMRKNPKPPQTEVPIDDDDKHYEKVNYNQKTQKVPCRLS